MTCVVCSLSVCGAFPALHVVCVPRMICGVCSLHGAMHRLPLNIGYMTALQFVDLTHNMLTGASGAPSMQPPVFLFSFLLLSAFFNMPGLIVCFAFPPLR